MEILGRGFELIKNQLEAIDTIPKEKDALCILPTNYGKSVIFELLPSVFKHFNTDILKPNKLVTRLQVSLIKITIDSSNTKPYGLIATTFNKANQKQLISKGDFNVLYWDTRITHST